jgi:hypothetical protein
MLHPITLASFLSLSCQALPSIKSDDTGFTMKKLLCTSVGIPYSAALVYFKCDFFREPSSVLEDVTPMDPSYPVELQQLPPKPIGLGGVAEIRSQINFQDLFVYNEKNITLKL